MKKLLLFSLLIVGWVTVKSQTTGDILKREAAQGVREGANAATQTTANKVTDKILGKIFGKKKEKNKNNNNNNNSNNSSADNQNKNVVTNSNTTVNDATQSGKDNSESASLKTYSKYDFIPGEKILAYDDFSKDAIGDFPVKWNTNSSGEVVTSSAREGHWLMFTKQGKFIPEYITNLPDNFTFEFDVACNENFSYYSPFLSLYFLTGKNGKEVFDNWFMADGKRSGVKISIQPTSGKDGGGLANVETFEDGQSIMKNEVNTTQFNDNGGKGGRYVHVSIWRQKQRIRIYLNEEKVYDLPRAFPENTTYSTVLYEIWGDFKDQDRYLLGNIKFSAGAPDTRNKLMTEGKFSTTGILFDVNSATIKPESYGVLKDIASVLTENNTVRVKIIGHTDSDGDAAMNLSLSKKRAEAVKEALTKEFGIAASRMETDGKGATQPLAPNTTPEGKAQNRRVEFIKG